MAALAAMVVLAGLAHADDFTTSANICHPVPSSIFLVDYSNAGIRNITTQYTATVICAIPVEMRFKDPIKLQLDINDHSTTADVSCTWTLSGNHGQQFGSATVTTSGTTSDNTPVYEIFAPDGAPINVRNMTLTCKLPPRTSLGASSLGYIIYSTIL
jgi:hypothetical protein